MQPRIRWMHLAAVMREDESNGNVVATCQSGEVLYASNGAGFGICIDRVGGKDE